MQVRRGARAADTSQTGGGIDDSGTMIVPDVSFLETGAGVELWIRGRAISNKSVAEIRLCLNDRVVGRLIYRRPLERPLEVSRRRRGFEYFFAFNLPVTFLRDQTTNEIAIETADSEGIPSRNVVGFWPRCENTGTPDDRLDRKKALAEQPAVPVIVLHTERAVLDRGALQVTGWVASQAPVNAVQATLSRPNQVVRAMLGKPQDGTVQTYGIKSACIGFIAVLRIISDDAPSEVEVVAFSNDGSECRSVIPVLSLEVESPRAATRTDSPSDNNRSTVDALIHIESPETVGDVAWRAERRTINLRGWAIAMDQVSHLSVYVDGRFVGKAAYGGRRPDIARFYSGWKSPESSGFTLRLDARLFLTEQPNIRVELHTELGGVAYRDIAVRYRPRPGRPVLSYGPSTDTLMSDPTIWTAAFTAHMAHSNPITALDGLEEKFRAVGDDAQADRIVRVRAARELLVAAWGKRPIDPMLAKYLSDLGYYPQ